MYGTTPPKLLPSPPLPLPLLLLLFLLLLLLLLLLLPLLLLPLAMGGGGELSNGSDGSGICDMAPPSTGRSCDDRSSQKAS